MVAEARLDVDVRLARQRGHMAALVWMALGATGPPSARARQDELDERLHLWRLVPPARVVQIEPGEGRREVRQHALQPLGLDMRQRQGGSRGWTFRRGRRPRPWKGRGRPWRKRPPADGQIDDCVASTKATVAAWVGTNGRQGGDPAKLAAALVMLGGLGEPPARFVAGADAVEAAETKANTLLSQANALRELSSSLDY